MLKNITLSAEEALIRAARLQAAKEKSTLNAAFRGWLTRYAGRETSRETFQDLMKRFDSVRFARKFTRDEMNER